MSHRIIDRRLNIAAPFAALTLIALLAGTHSAAALPHQSAKQAGQQHSASESAGPFDPNVVQPFARGDSNSLSGENRFDNQRGDEPR